MGLYKLIIWVLKLYYGSSLLDPPVEGKWQNDSHPAGTPDGSDICKCLTS